MGEIAEMMLDGTLCEGCGVHLGSDSGVPTRCRNCRPSKAERKAENVARSQAEQDAAKKTPCPICGKRLRLVGMADHQKDAHGGKPLTKVVAAPVFGEWLPIETAPKEEELLGWRDDCGVLLIMHTSYDRFADERECEEIDEDTLFQKDWFGAFIPGGMTRLDGTEVPTHWMPKPAAPGATS